MIDDGKKFNILYLHNESVMGGAEISLLNLVKGLNKKIFVPHFACSKEGPFIDELRKTEILPDFVQFPGIRWPNPVQIYNTVRNLTDIIKKKQIDLIHSNQPRSNLFGAIAAKIKNIPIVWHERCLESGMFDSDNIFSFLPDRIICNSSVVRDRFTKVGIDTKIKTILNGVDLREFDPELKELNGKTVRREFNIGEEELIIGTVGRIDPEKGYEYFLESARIILQDYKNVRFLVVGGAFNNPSLEELLYEMSVEKGIYKKTIFTGFRKDIPQILAGMDVVVLPSGIDACSRVLFESMAMRRPLVATNAGGTPEVVQEGVTGLLVEPGNSSEMAECIMKLLNNRNLAEQFGNAGRKRVEEMFTIERNTKKIESVYLELLDTNFTN